MTNKDKSELRRIMLNGTTESDRDLADEFGCAVSTVRKYRKVFAPLTPTKGPTP